MHFAEHSGTQQAFYKKPDCSHIISWYVSFMLSPTCIGMPFSLCFVHNVLYLDIAISSQWVTILRCASDEFVSLPEWHCTDTSVLL